MTRSIRLRFLNRLRHLVDHISKKPVKGLGCSKVYSMPGRYLNDWVVVCIDDGLSKAEINDAVMAPKLGEHVDVGNRNACVSYLPPFWPNCQLSTASYNDFIIRHQKPPIGKIYDVSTVNRRMAGVES